MENTEFDDMREQISLLKKKLEKETIINDNMLRETINSKVNTIRKMEWLGYIAIFFVVTVGSMTFHKIGLSWWFVGGTTLLMLVVGIYNYIMHIAINDSDIMSDDLLTTAKKIKKVKQDYMTWFKIGFPLVFVWLGWFIYELYSINNDWESVMFLIFSGVTGGLIGGLIGFAKYRKILRSCDEIIKDIEK